MEYFNDNSFINDQLDMILAHLDDNDTRMTEGHAGLTAHQDLTLDLINELVTEDLERMEVAEALEAYHRDEQAGGWRPASPQDSSVLSPREKRQVEEALEAYRRDEEAGGWPSQISSTHPYSPQPGPSRIQDQGPESPQPGTSGLQHKRLPESPRPGPSGLGQRPLRQATINQYGGLGPALPETDEESQEDVQPPPYTFRMRRERTYTNNAAVERTYQVRFDDRYKGSKLDELYGVLYDMFVDVLHRARGGLEDTDLCVITIHHAGLNDPIVIPLQPWRDVSVDVVMGRISDVLNSNEDLRLDDSFEITIGSIALPKGGKRRKITRLHGKDSSLNVKKSVITVQNDEDQLCLPRAIAVVWAKLVQCSAEEWEVISANRAPMETNIHLALRYRKVSKSLYKNITKKRRHEQESLALELCRRAGIPTNRQGTLNDLEAFEDLLKIRLLVISASVGNKFIRVGSNTHPDRPQGYLYLIDDNHFNAVTSITGFFGSSYFCTTCLKPYSDTIHHSCETTCIVCKSGDCPKKDTPVTCRSCNMDCRSQACFDRHRKLPKQRTGDTVTAPMSQCQRWWKCSTCFKVINRKERDLEQKPHTCGEYFCTTCKTFFQDSDHYCYQKAYTFQEQPITDRKFVFFDFECSQDQLATCVDGYLPGPPCQGCSCDVRCSVCQRCSNCLQSWCGRRRHVPNYCVVQTACKVCMDEPFHESSRCDSCGSRCPECNVDETDDKDGNKPCADTCGFRQVEFSGPNTLDDFGKWLFNPNHRYTTVIAHNMKGYDGVFLLQYLLDNAMRPDKIIYQGSKIAYMAVESELHIRVLDSMSFLPMPLKALPGAFGLHERVKGFFPHFFNTAEHQNYVGPYPSADSYGVDYMSTKERANFLEWYQTKQGKTFDFRQEMETYCVSDVTILREACLRFRQLMLDITDGQVDPFSEVTIASCCMKVYKTLFLEEDYEVKLSPKDKEPCFQAKCKKGKWKVLKDTEWIPVESSKLRLKTWKRSAIAQVPAGGYVNRTRYSRQSIQWLQWTMRCESQRGHPIRIQHALNGGEYKVPKTKYHVDGYCVQTNTVYEYQGCLFHGCTKCFPSDRNEIRHPRTRQSVEELYSLTKKKEKVLKTLGYKYVAVWEHEFQTQIRENPELRSFLDTLDIQERLEPRDSFFGGRTNASCLHKKAEGDEKIHYVDFTSLYPWTNKTARYPVGHPEIIHDNFLPVENYFGIIKAKIVPPRGLYHPVLPHRSQGKLKFPLCRTCADEELLSLCHHTDEQRALTGTWCTPEILKAMEMGYTVLKVYEVYHWPEITQYDATTKQGGLFSEYVNVFLKLKQEASGWPSWCKTEDDKKNYVDNYYRKEGIKLDPSKIEKNPGLRSLAKLMLNSFWGKFGQRLNLKQSSFFHRTQLEQFYRTLTDPQKEIQHFHIISDDYIQLEWTHRNNFIPEDLKSNVFLASFTTCWARLKLYSVLEALGERVLYYDTDSVIFVSKPGSYNPPLGDYLGELTDELDGQHIEEFVSSGPKSYGYRTNKGKEVVKMKGFSLNYVNSRLINMETVKAMVTNVDPTKSHTFKVVKEGRKRKGIEFTAPAEKKRCIQVQNLNKITRNKGGTILYNRPEIKKYRVVFTKRVIQPDLNTLPYGY